MKKIFFMLTTCIILLLITPSNSLAYFEIDKFVIDATLSEQGDLHIVEKISYKTDEYRNGVFRNIDIKNPNNLKNSSDELQLLSVSVDEIEYSKIDQAQNGDDNAFTAKQIAKDRVQIKVFAPFNTSTKMVNYTYVLKNVGVKYNDTAEIFWNYIGKEWEDNINSLEINIILPEIANEDKTYVFGHGSDNGRFEKSGNNITLYAQNIKPGQAIDARVLFSRDSLTLSNKTINENVLSKYINKEQRMYKNSEKIQTQNNIILGMSIAIIIFWIYVFLKYGKGYKDEKHQYYRELPNGISPPILTCFYKGKEYSKLILVIFLDLIREGIYRIEESVNKIGAKTYKIIYDNNENVELIDYERSLIGLISRASGNVTDLESLKSVMKNYPEAYKDYKDVINKINTKSISMFGEIPGVPGSIISVCMISMLLLFGTIIFVGGENFNYELSIMSASFLAFTTIVYSVFFLNITVNISIILFFVIHFSAFQFGNIMLLREVNLQFMYIPYILLFFLIQYIFRIKKYTPEQKVLINKIEGLKRYIKDFSKLDEKKIGSIVLWEEFFVMAVAFGINKKVMNKFFNNFASYNMDSNLSKSIRVFGSYSAFNSYTFASMSRISGSSSSRSSGGFSGGSSSGGGGGGSF